MFSPVIVANLCTVANANCGKNQGDSESVLVLPINERAGLQRFSNAELSSSVKLHMYLCIF